MMTNDDDNDDDGNDDDDDNDGDDNDDDDDDNDGNDDDGEDDDDDDDYDNDNGDEGNDDFDENIVVLFLLLFSQFSIYVIVTLGRLFQLVLFILFKTEQLLSHGELCCIKNIDL